LFYEGDFSEGGPHGEQCVLYHEDGSLKYVGGMENSYYSGYGKGFYDNGEVFLEGTFKRGKLHGDKCKIYKDNTQLIFQGGMINGIPNGHCKEYNEKGKVITMGNFINGKLVTNNAMLKTKKQFENVRHMSISDTRRKLSQSSNKITNHGRSTSKFNNNDSVVKSTSREEKAPNANWAVSQFLSNNNDEIFIQNQSEIMIKTEEKIIAAKNKTGSLRDRSNTENCDFLRKPNQNPWEKSILYDNENPNVKSINISAIYGKDEPSFIDNNAFDRVSSRPITPRSLNKNEKRNVDSYKHVPRPTSQKSKRPLNFRRDSISSKDQSRQQITSRSDKIQSNEINIQESY